MRLREKPGVEGPRARRTLEGGLGAAHRVLARERGGGDAAHGEGSHGVGESSLGAARGGSAARRAPGDRINLRC